MGCVRVITTSYMGATDPKAVEVLRELPRPKFASAMTPNERLHAKVICFIGIQASVALCWFSELVKRGVV